MRTAAFTAAALAIRLVSGALVLMALDAAIRGSRPAAGSGGSWASAAALFAYASAFSFAYVV